MPAVCTPSVSVRLAELATEAGLPPGILNVVHGGKEVGEAINDHPDIKAVSFVGSTPVAKSVYARGAAIPTVYLTAWHALVDTAGLRRGERVLVHAAAGGVGIAAVQIAHHLGAEVVATAHPSKWEVVRGLGVDESHLASSALSPTKRPVPG